MSTYCRVCGALVVAISGDLCESCFADGQDRRTLYERDRKYQQNLFAAAIPSARRTRLTGGVAGQAAANTFLGAARESQTSSRASRPAGTPPAGQVFQNKPSAVPQHAAFLGGRTLASRAVQ
jgi:hypothetical protein